MTVLTSFFVAEVPLHAHKASPIYKVPARSLGADSEWRLACGVWFRGCLGRTPGGRAGACGTEQREVGAQGWWVLQWDKWELTGLGPSEASTQQLKKSFIQWVSMPTQKGF